MSFLRWMATSTKRTTSNSGLTHDPSMARRFELDIDKAEVLEWIESERGKIARYADPDTMKIMIFEQTLIPVPDNDIEWKTSLQRSGVAKLSKLEIEALGLEKYEIERRLSK
jgi:hypothetical protein